MGIAPLDGSPPTDPCLDKLKPGEPFFVLRGQDMLAPDVIQIWVERAAESGQLSERKFEEVISIIMAMENWPNRRMPD